MGFTRNWDSSCPRVWDSWETDGTKWVIQDLAPEDDNTALELLVNHLLTDETLCNLSSYFYGDLTEFFGCYTEIEGKKTLVALNLCIVANIEEKLSADDIFVHDVAWKNVFNAMEYVESKCNTFEYLGVDRLLNALGLVVKPEFRGHKLGSKILTAMKTNRKESLCKSQGPQPPHCLLDLLHRSQQQAVSQQQQRSGFETRATVTLK
ncbi:uncharacterized protein LOC125068903 [Vanessa atalanta]|uniref:uncharacterized protein LOC125068903 n=1 Tax=Vanessa atalanta TaxID=42275 RepID=UPI001FCD4E31|nr:uncharacterized protein LOC125068903 [Vanessa atalanta]